MARERNIKLPAYIRNVSDSFKYMATEEFKKVMPATHGFISTNADLGREVVDSVKDFKKFQTKVSHVIKSNPAIVAVAQARKDAIADLKSGMLYNKHRKDRYAAEASGFGGGFDDSELKGMLDGFDFGDSPNINFHIGGGGDSAALGDEIIESGSYVGSQVIKSSTYLGDVISNIGKGQMSATVQMGEKSNAIASTIGTNITQVLSFLNENTIRHYQDAGQFYADALAEMRAIRTMAEYQSEIYHKTYDKPQTEQKQSKYDRVMGYEGFDIKQYMSVVKENIQEEFGNATMGTFNMFGDTGQGMEFMLKTALASPLEFIPKAIIKKVIPKVVTESMQGLDKTLELFFPAMIAKFNRLSFEDIMDDSTGKDMIFRKVGQYLGKIFGVNAEHSTLVDTGAYNKEAVPFDGVTRKAITEVIPSYLRELVAAVTGQEAKVYNYDTGKFESLSQQALEFKRIKNDISGTATLKSKMTSLLDETYAITDKDLHDEVIKNFDIILKQLVEQGGYDPNGLDKVDKLALTTMVDKEQVQMFNDLFKSLSKHDQLAALGDISKTRLNTTQNTQKMTETMAMSGLSQAINGLIDIEQYKNDQIVDYMEDATKKFNRITGQEIRPSAFIERDIYNKTPADYLRSILDTLTQGIYVVVKENQASGDSTTIGSSSVLDNELSRRQEALKRTRADDETKHVTRQSQALAAAESARESFMADKMRTLGYTRDEQNRFVRDANIDGKDITAQQIDSWYSIDMNRNRERIQEVVNKKEALKAEREKKEKDAKYRDSMAALFFGDDSELGKNVKKLTDSISEYLKKPTKLFTDTIKKIDNTLYELVFGTEEKGEGSFIDKMLKGFRDKLDAGTAWIRDHVFIPLNNKLFGTDGFFTKIRESKLFEQIFGQRNETGDRVGGLFGGIKDNVSDMFSAVGNFMFGKEYVSKVTGKTIPQKLDNVMSYIGGGFKSLTSGVMDSVFGKAKYEIDPETGKATIIGREGGVLNDVLQNFKDKFSQFSNYLFGNGIDTGNFLQKILPKGIAGAIIGGLGGLAIGNPVLGMYLGAGGAFASQSEKVKNFLFGEKGEDGMREGGFIPAGLQDFFKRNGTVLAGGGLTGLVGSIFLPGGPIIGSLLGATIGFATRSDEVKGFLFGTETDEGIISKEFQEAFKKYAPSGLVSAGIGGLLGSSLGLLGGFFGPMGIVGGAALGLAVDISRQNENVHRFLFGEKNQFGGIIKDGLFTKIGTWAQWHILEPMKLGAQKIGLNLQEWFENSIAYPIKKMMDPIREQFKIMGEAVVDMIKDTWSHLKEFMGGVFERTIGKPFGEFMEEKFFNPMKKFLGKILGGAGKIIGGIISSPIKALGFLASGLEKNHEKAYNKATSASGQREYAKNQAKLDTLKQRAELLYGHLSPGEIKMLTGKHRKEYNKLMHDISDTERAIAKHDRAVEHGKYTQSGQADVRKTIENRTIEVEKLNNQMNADKFRDYHSLTEDDKAMHSAITGGGDVTRYSVLNEEQQALFESLKAKYKELSEEEKAEYQSLKDRYVTLSDAEQTEYEALKSKVDALTEVETQRLAELKGKEASLSPEEIERFRQLRGIDDSLSPQEKVQFAELMTKSKEVSEENLRRMADIEAKISSISESDLAEYNTLRQKRDSIQAIIDKDQKFLDDRSDAKHEKRNAKIAEKRAALAEREDAIRGIVKGIKTQGSSFTLGDAHTDYAVKYLGKNPSQSLDMMIQSIKDGNNPVQNTIEATQLTMDVIFKTMKEMLHDGKTEKDIKNMLDSFNQDIDTIVDDRLKTIRQYMQAAGVENLVNENISMVKGYASEYGGFAKTREAMDIANQRLGREDEDSPKWQIAKATEVAKSVDKAKEELGGLAGMTAKVTNFFKDLVEAGRGLFRRKEMGPVKFNYGEDAIDTIIDEISNRVPEFARGAIVRRRTLAVVGEAGEEAILPITDFKEAVAALKTIADSIVTFVNGQIPTPALAGTGGGTIPVNQTQVSRTEDEEEPQSGSIMNKMYGAIKSIADEVVGQLNGVGWNTNRIAKILIREFGALENDDSPDYRGNKKFSPFRAIGDFFRNPIKAVKGFLMKPINMVIDFISKPFRIIKAQLDKAAAFVKNLGSTIKKGLGFIWGKAKEFAKAVFVDFPKKIFTTIGNILGVVKDGIVGAVKFIATGVSNVVKGIASAIGSVISGIGSGIKFVIEGIGKGIKSAVTFVGDMLVGAGKAVAGFVKGFGEAVWSFASGLGNLVMKTIPLAVKALSGLADAAVTIGTTIIKTVKDLAVGVLDVVTRPFKSIIGFFAGKKPGVQQVQVIGGTLDKVKVIDTVKRISGFQKGGEGGLPKLFADGGFVTKPTNAILGEDGDEAVIPLSEQKRGIGTKIFNAVKSLFAKSDEEADINKSLLKTLTSLMTYNKKMSEDISKIVVSTGDTAEHTKEIKEIEEIDETTGKPRKRGLMGQISLMKDTIFGSLKEKFGGNVPPVSEEQKKENVFTKILGSIRGMTSEDDNDSFNSSYANLEADKRQKVKDGIQDTIARNTTDMVDEQRKQTGLFSKLFGKDSLLSKIGGFLLQFGPSLLKLGALIAGVIGLLNMFKGFNIKDQVTNIVDNTLSGLGDLWNWIKTGEKTEHNQDPIANAVLAPADINVDSRWDILNPFKSLSHVKTDAAGNKVDNYSATNARNQGLFLENVKRSAWNSSFGTNIAPMGASAYQKEQMLGQSYLNKAKTNPDKALDYYEKYEQSQAKLPGLASTKDGTPSFFDTHATVKNVANIGSSLAVGVVGGKATGFVTSKIAKGVTGMMGLDEDLSKNIEEVSGRMGETVGTVVVTTQALQNKGLAGKAKDALLKALDFILTKLSKNAKFAAATEIIEGLMKSIKGQLEKGFQKIANLLAKVFSKETAKAGTGAATLGIGTAVLAGTGAIAGGCGVENLFLVPPGQADALMTTIASTLGAIFMAVPFVGLIEVLDILLVPVLGKGIRQLLADILYRACGGGVKLEGLQANWQGQMNSYNERFGTNLDMSTFNDMSNKKATSKIFGKGAARTDSEGNVIFDDAGAVVQTGHGMAGWVTSRKDYARDAYGNVLRRTDGKAIMGVDIHGNKLQAQKIGKDGELLYDDDGNPILEGKKLGDYIGSAGKAVADFFTGKKTYKVDDFGNVIYDPETGKPILDSKEAGLFGKIGGFFGGVGKGIGKMFVGAGNLAKKGWEGLFGSKAKQAIDDDGELLFDENGNPIMVDAKQGLFGKIGGFFGGVGKKIGGAFTGAKNFLFGKSSQQMLNDAGEPMFDENGNPIMMEGEKGLFGKIGGFFGATAKKIGGAFIGFAKDPIGELFGGKRVQYDENGEMMFDENGEPIIITKEGLVGKVGKFMGGVFSKITSAVSGTVKGAKEFFLGRAPVYKTDEFGTILYDDDGKPIILEEGKDSLITRMGKGIGNVMGKIGTFIGGVRSKMKGFLFGREQQAIDENGNLLYDENGEPIMTRGDNLLQRMGKGLGSFFGKVGNFIGGVAGQVTSKAKDFLFGKSQQMMDDDGNLLYDENGQPIMTRGDNLLQRMGKGLGSFVGKVGTFIGGATAPARDFLFGRREQMMDENGNLLYDENGEPIMTRGDNLLQRMGKGLGSFFGKVGNFVGGVGSKIKGFLFGKEEQAMDEDGNLLYDDEGNPIMVKGDNLLQRMGKGIGSFLGQVGNVVGGVGSKIKGFLFGHEEQAVDENGELLFDDDGNPIMKTTKGIFGKLGSAFGDAIGGVGKAIKSWQDEGYEKYPEGHAKAGQFILDEKGNKIPKGGLGNWAKRTLGSLAGGVAGLVTGAADAVSSIAENIKDGVTDFAGKVGNFFSGLFGKGGDLEKASGMGGRIKSGMGTPLAPAAIKPQSSTTTNIKKINDVPLVNGIPYFSQRDSAWSNKSYKALGESEGTIGDAGCGPTSAAMVLSYFTRKMITPEEVANWAAERGYKIPGSGTHPAFFDEVGQQYGLSGFNSYDANDPSKSRAIEAMRHNSPIIMLGQKSSQNSPFTNAGHFIVGTSIDNGKVYINDPMGMSQSGVYDWNKVYGETRKFWVLNDNGSTIYSTEAQTPASDGSIYPSQYLGVPNKNGVPLGAGGFLDMLSEIGALTTELIDSTLMGREFDANKALNKDPLAEFGATYSADGSGISSYSAGSIDGPVEKLTTAQVAAIQSNRSSKQITDLETMKKFNVSWAASPTYHSDVTPMTSQDTDVIKSILHPNGGVNWSNVNSWSWNGRPGVLDLNGRKIAVGYHLRPHAAIMGGNPGSPFSNQSNTKPDGGWPLGGHFCMYYGDSPGGTQSCNTAADNAYILGNAAYKANLENPTLTGTDNESKIYGYLRQKGLNDYAISGLMGNLYAESHLIPNMVQGNIGKPDKNLEYTAKVDNGEINFAQDKTGGGGYGLAQWTWHTRKQGLLDLAKSRGKSVGDLGVQLDYLWNELQGYDNVMSVLNRASSIREASDSVLFNFERPADQGITVQNTRSSYGQTYYDKFAGSNALMGGSYGTGGDGIIDMISEIGALTSELIDANIMGRTFDANSVLNKDSNAIDVSGYNTSSDYTGPGDSTKSIYNKGDLVPLPGVNKSYTMTSPYGNRINPTNPSNGTQFHTGIDIGAPLGTPIYAPFDGVLKMALSPSQSGGYGNVFEIAPVNGGPGYLYAHMNRFASGMQQKGKQVVKGQQIGEVGSTGNSTGPHIHFEYRQVPGDKESRIDPIKGLFGQQSGSGIGGSNARTGGSIESVSKSLGIGGPTEEFSGGERNIATLSDELSKELNGINNMASRVERVEQEINREYIEAATESKGGRSFGLSRELLDILEKVNQGITRIGDNTEKIADKDMEINIVNKVVSDGDTSTDDDDDEPNAFLNIIRNGNNGSSDKQKSPTSGLHDARYEKMKLVSQGVKY